MNILISALLVVVFWGGFSSMKAPTIETEDLQVLTGATWVGSLSYLDYRTNKKVSIPSNLVVTRPEESESSWIFEYQYPDEPKANSKEIVTLSKNGKLINGEKVIEKANSAEQHTLTFVTEANGPDNDKDALFRFTYLLSKTHFSIKKEVKYEDATEFFLRNQYSWKR